jgi:hypothetical protein
VRAMASPPRVVAAAAAAGECPPGHVWVGVEELRSAMWRALKCFGHSDADAATLMDVCARRRPAHARVRRSAARSRAAAVKRKALSLVAPAWRAKSARVCACSLLADASPRAQTGHPLRAAARQQPGRDQDHDGRSGARHRSGHNPGGARNKALWCAACTAPRAARARLLRPLVCVWCCAGAGAACVRRRCALPQRTCGDPKLPLTRSVTFSRRRSAPQRPPQLRRRRGGPRRRHGGGEGGGARLRCVPPPRCHCARSCARHAC